MIEPVRGLHNFRGVTFGVAGWLVALALAACGGDEVGSATDVGSTSGASSTGGTSPGDASEGTSLPTTGGGVSEGMTTTGGETTSTTTTTTDPTTSGDSGTTMGVEESGTSTGTPPGVCGDGVVDAEEDCDGAELGGQTCESQGFESGELACLDTCTFDTQGCAACGNSVIEAGETCDDGNTMAGDGCDEACQTEMVEMCDPDGVYAVQGPALSYMCCVGLVSVNINSFTLSNDAATIASSPSNPTPLLGTATTCPDGDFNNSGKIAGGCTENYEVSGSFTDKDTWTGQYKLTFTGDQCSCFNGMLGTPCVNQVFPVTAKR